MAGRTTLKWWHAAGLRRLGAVGVTVAVVLGMLVATAPASSASDVAGKIVGATGAGGPGCIAYIGNAHISTSPQSRGDVKVAGGFAGCRSQVTFAYVTVALYKTGNGTSHLVGKTSCSSNMAKVLCSWGFYQGPYDRYPPTVPAGHYFFNQNSHIQCQDRAGVKTTFFGDLVQPTYLIYDHNSYWAPTNTYSISPFPVNNCWTPTS